MAAAEIATPSATNRMVASPNTKAMNANSFVDFGAVAIITSVKKAEALGIARDRWAFPRLGGEGHATFLFSERENYHSSPAIRHTGQACLGQAGVGIDDITYMDFCSCFPSVVQITMDELGIPVDRQATTTGGLGFFGGPMNSYVLHATASIVDAVRSDPGSYGFVHVNGGFATKHACAVYSLELPPTPFRRVDFQPDIDAYPTRHVDESPSGIGEIKAYTVMHSREGRGYALATAIMADGRRAFASSADADLMGAMVSQEFVGRRATAMSSGSFEFY